MGVQPKVTIGITGHRPNRMHIGRAEIARQLHIVLAAIRSGSGRHTERVAVSALAEGSDRIFADAALELNYRLDVVLPFNSADYETTFSDKQETPHYRELLAKAHMVTELDGSLNDSTAAYEEVGRAMVNTVDLIICVWDGKAAAGRGGTPEIVEYAISLGKNVIWINAATKRTPRLIAPASGYVSTETPMMTLARRARKLTRQRIARLAAVASQL